MAKDNFQYDRFASTSISCARSGYLVTPHDTNELPSYSGKGLWVVTGGTLTVVFAGDDATTGALNLGTVAAGAYIPFVCRIVKATGTTATVIALTI